MRLYDILPQAKEQNIPDCEITSVTDNTAEIKAGCIFFCIQGEHFDGHNAAEDALNSGAAVVVCQKDMNLKSQVLVPDTRKAFSKAASAFYGNPSKKLKLIGVTGTNGKSTITEMIRFILNANQKPCGSIGTIGYDVLGKVYEAHLTTPKATDFYRYLSEMAENGAEYCVMEASSLALAQNRFDEEVFEVGIFANLTQDHLDWHKTMEAYFQAKKRLFTMTKKAVVNLDDSYGKRLFSELTIPKISTSMENPADYYSINIKSNNAGVSYWLSSTQAEKSYPLTCKIPGLHNVMNSMQAIACCVELGVPLGDCVKALSECPGVRGRCEVIWDGDFTVLSDYAHTQDALEKILNTVRGFAKKRIICLFGAAGERDAEKRKPMGDTVGKLADYAVVTSDNPRFEDPKAIIDQVVIGIEKHGTPYSTFVDRKEAIEFALSEAQSGDIVLLCGKGHETYQVIGDEYQDFCEREIVQQILNGKERAN